LSAASPAWQKHAPGGIALESPCHHRLARHLVSCHLGLGLGWNYGGWRWRHPPTIIGYCPKTKLTWPRPPLAAAPSSCSRAGAFAAISAPGRQVPPTAQPDAGPCLAASCGQASASRKVFTAGRRCARKSELGALPGDGTPVAASASHPHFHPRGLGQSGMTEVLRDIRRRYGLALGFWPECLRRIRVKRDFACTFTRHVVPVLVVLRSRPCLRLEGRTRTLTGPSPDLSPARTTAGSSSRPRRRPVPPPCLA
jgi:hypothetical protein